MLGATILSMLGYLSAALMSQPRLLYSLAVGGGLLPAWLTAIHPRFRTPWIAIAVQNAIVLAAALSGSFAVLVPLASVAILTVYLMVALSALVMQRRARAACRSVHGADGGAGGRRVAGAVDALEGAAR